MGGRGAIITWKITDAWTAAATVTAAAYGVPAALITAPSRGRGPRPATAVQLPKKMAVYLAVVLAGCDYAALGRAIGLPMGAMLRAVGSYRGEPHRVELVERVGDVDYIEDSKGTNVGATVAALIGLGLERKIVVILGGEGKGQDFSPLAAPVMRHARAVVLIGRDAPPIRAALQSTGITLVDAATMAQAVAAGHELAQAGDAVLMSPACASFDMFDNYEHRAQMFCQAVRDLANAAGVTLEGAL